MFRPKAHCRSLVQLADRGRQLERLAWSRLSSPGADERRLVGALSSPAAARIENKRRPAQPVSLYPHFASANESIRARVTRLTKSLRVVSWASTFDCGARSSRTRLYISNVKKRFDLFTVSVCCQSVVWRSFSVSRSCLGRCWLEKWLLPAVWRRKPSMIWGSWRRRLWSARERHEHVRGSAQVPSIWANQRIACASNKRHCQMPLEKERELRVERHMKEWRKNETDNRKKWHTTVIVPSFSACCSWRRVRSLACLLPRPGLAASTAFSSCLRSFSRLPCSSFFLRRSRNRSVFSFSSLLLTSPRTWSSTKDKFHSSESCRACIMCRE